MNPFDLSGPQFLLLYLVLAVATLVALHLFRYVVEAGDGGHVTLSDPYLIAYLRGGKDEAIQVATVSLVDRGLLTAEDDTLTAKDAGAARLVRRPLEKALLERFEKRDQARTAFHDAGLTTATDQLRLDLARAGLLPDESVRSARNGRALLAIGLMTAIAVVKILVALARGRHNVALLVILAVVFAIAAAIVVHRPRTVRGDRLLADLRKLFGGLKDRAETLKAGGASAEAALLAAVFGIGALPGLEYGFVHALYPKASAGSSSSCGTSSCSSGSSCGSSCGGGGGCGGCGGS